MTRDEFPPIPEKYGDPPAGHRWCWKPEGAEWQLVTHSKPCRWNVGAGHRLCKQPSVARLDRAFLRHHGDKPIWWHYCEEHLYGRVIVDGVLYVTSIEPLQSDATVENTVAQQSGESAS